MRPRACNLSTIEGIFNVVDRDRVHDVEKLTGGLMTCYTGIVALLSSDRDPAHYGDAAHRAQPAQKLILEIVDLSEIKNRASRYIETVVQKVTCQ